MLFRKGTQGSDKTSGSAAAEMGASVPGLPDRDLATAFSAMEIATVGLDAMASAVGEAGVTVEAAARTANMNRRALLAARYETLRADIATLDDARRRSVRTILARGSNALALAQAFDPDEDQAVTLYLVERVEGFKDAAVIDAARDALTTARATLDHVAGGYREFATGVAERMVALGAGLTTDPNGVSLGQTDTDTSDDAANKRPSLGDRLLRGLFGARAA